MLPHSLSSSGFLFFSHEACSQKIILYPLIFQPISLCSLVNTVDLQDLRPIRAISCSYTVQAMAAIRVRRRDLGTAPRKNPPKPCSWGREQSKRVQYNVTLEEWQCYTLPINNASKMTRSKTKFACYDLTSTHHVDVADSICHSPVGRVDLNVGFHYVCRLCDQRCHNTCHNPTAEVHQRAVGR